MSPPPSDKKSSSATEKKNTDVVGTSATLLLSPRSLNANFALFQDLDSQAAEQYRHLAYAIERKRGEGKQVFVISSALQSEGKTITALNVAFALAEGCAGKVVLCDLDLRRSGISSALGLGELPGLTDVLGNDQRASDVLVRIGKNLALLPGGKPTPHPLALLRSSVWQDLLVSLKQHFDYILFDTAPLVLTDDMVILADAVDQVIMVVRSNSTTSDAVKEALAKIPTGKAFGFVLNDANPEECRNQAYYRRSKKPLPSPE